MAQGEDQARGPPQRSQVPVPCAEGTLGVPSLTTPHCLTSHLCRHTLDGSFRLSFFTISI